MSSGLIPYSEIPVFPGTYALVMEAHAPAELLVGRLGRLDILQGFYVYSGSALGPGGLRGRLTRHLRSRVLHWHVDYLKPIAPIQEIWFTCDPESREHQWARILASLPAANVLWPGFGSSGCRCPAHLVHFPERPSYQGFISELGSMVPASLRAGRWTPAAI